MLIRYNIIDPFNSQDLKKLLLCYLLLITRYNLDFCLHAVILLMEVQCAFVSGHTTSYITSWSYGDQIIRLSSAPAQPYHIYS